MRQAEMSKPSKESAPVVSRLIERTRNHVMPDGVWTDGKRMISTNRVVGWSVNVPIFPTCHPTKVCVETCYYANGVTATPSGLEKQTLVMRSIQLDPVGCASRIARELREVGASFVRWNGGGDLFPESVACINAFAVEAPEIPVWVVTRKPRVAADIVDAPSVFVHLSLDKSSRSRLRTWLDLQVKPSRWFASYQADRGERVDMDALTSAGFSVVFLDNYTGEPQGGASCPLNGAKSIEGGCLRCGRCWTDTAVKMRDEAALRSWGEE